MAQDDPKLNFTGLNSDLAARWQAGVPDANGHPPERHVTAAGTGPYRIVSARSQAAKPISFSPIGRFPNRNPMPRWDRFSSAPRPARAMMGRRCRRCS